jgi:tetratricopeptide (TPR) repeat protein
VIPDISLENVQNAIVGSTVATDGGDVLVNGQKVTNYFYSAQYQELIKRQNRLQERFNKTRQKIDKYPDEEDFRVELSQINEERQEVQKKLDDLKSEVIRLAETFTKISLNTERLRVARQYFEASDYPAARAILDAEQMGSELDALLQQKEQLQQQQAKNEANLLDKANEFLILARLTAIDFTLPDRFKKTIEYFEQSLKAAHTEENTLAYAYFLQKHNQFKAASPWYEEALVLYLTLAQQNPAAYLPYLATTLNNLGLLYGDTQRLEEAEQAYQEAVQTYRDLAQQNPAAYLPDVAMTLNNLGLLYGDTQRLEEAEQAYQEAVQIRRTLAQQNPPQH